jgi:hypothetical protein
VRWVGQGTVLEIVEGEAIGSCVCTQAYAVLTIAGCMRWVLVSMGWLGRTKRGDCYSAITSVLYCTVRRHF